MRKICPRCGADDSKKRFIGLFCEDCYAERLDISIERNITISTCRKCGRVHLGNEWVPPTRQNIERILKRSIKGKYESVRFIVPESGEGDSTAVFLIRAGDGFVEVVRQFTLSRHLTLCEDDSRATSGYYEAIIQVRCHDLSKSASLAEKIKNEISRKSFVTRFEESKYGFDIYVGSNKVAAAALETLGLKAERSAKLHGVKDGQRIYRITYCVRD